MDYLALDMTAQRIATMLAQQHGTGPGDRIAVLLPDTPELAFAAYGILWAGGVLCPVGPENDPDALADTLTSTRPKLLIGWHAYAETVEHVAGALELDWLLVEPREFGRRLAETPPRSPLADVAGDAPAMLLGPPSLLALGHADLALRAKHAARELGLGPGVVVAAPTSLSNPLNQIRTLHAAVTVGAALRLAGTPLTATSRSASTDSIKRR